MDDASGGAGRLVEAEAVRRGIAAIHRHIRRRIQEQALGLGFTVPQFRALREVVAHPGVTVTGLAQLLQSGQSTVSGIVERLVVKGLLERRRDPRDGRASTLWPAPAVEAFLAQRERLEFANRPVAHLLARLDPEQRALVVRAVRLLAAQVAEVEGRGDEHAE